MILSRENLVNVTVEGVKKPQEHIFNLPEKVLQFGTGVLLRGLIDDYIDKANRKSQSEFVCKSCGFADNADHVGAVNIARRADVSRPLVAAIGSETHSCDTSSRLVTSPSL